MRRRECCKLRHRLGITRADQFPSVNAGGNITSQASPTIGPIPSYQVTLGQVNASASWIPHFWGRYRRATEAARAELLASYWAQQAVASTLVANAANSYFQIRALDLQLDIAQRTLASRKESLQLTRTLEEHGFDTLLDVRQAQQLVYAAAAQVPDLERQIEQQENALSILLGNNPGTIPRGLKLTEQPHPPEVPAGLPSALWKRRPDIREAEEKLIAANAQIGVRKSCLLSTDLVDRIGRIREHSAHKSLYRPGRDMELWWDAYPTYLSRRKTEIKCAAGRSSASGIALNVSTNDPGCVSRCFERARCLSQIPGVSRPRGTPDRTQLRMRRGFPQFALRPELRITLKCSSTKRIIFRISLRLPKRN